MRTINETYMQRALNLAKLGERRAAPNPMVGCVIVHQGQIIGEGYHQKYGDPHAEVNAINAVQNQALLKASTLYVTLEPCAHFGKTPPCANLIVEKQISKVVIGTIDPFAKVAGKGIEKLKQAGCQVEVGILCDECRELNRRFFTFHQKQRPYIILKWAQTADGFVDVDLQQKNLGYPTWITNEMARIAVHKQRSTEQAILVGTNTALQDNPSLTLRDWHGQQPVRMVIDRHNRLPKNLSLFDGKSETYVVCKAHYPEKRNCNEVIIKPGDDSISTALGFLFEKEIQSVIVEGGPKLLQSFIDQNLWDEAHVYTGQLTFGNGVKAPVFNESPIFFDRFYNSELRVFRNR